MDGTVKDHKGHDYDLIVDKAEQSSKVLLAKTQKAFQMQQEIMNVITLVKKREEESLPKEAIEAKASIKNQFALFMDLLQKREASLLKLVDWEETKSKTALAHHRERLLVAVGTMDSNIELANRTAHFKSGTSISTMDALQVINTSGSIIHELDKMMETATKETMPPRPKRIVYDEQHDNGVKLLVPFANHGKVMVECTESALLVQFSSAINPFCLNPTNWLMHISIAITCMLAKLHYIYEGFFHALELAQKMKPWSRVEIAAFTKQGLFPMKIEQVHKSNTVTLAKSRDETDNE